MQKFVRIRLKYLDIKGASEYVSLHFLNICRSLVSLIETRAGNVIR